MHTRHTRFLRLAVTLLAMSVGGTALLALDDEEEREIAFSDLPQVIQAALDGVDVDEAEVNMKDGKRVYEVEIEADDVEVELILAEDGRLLGVEIEVEEKEDED